MGSTQKGVATLAIKELGNYESLNQFITTRIKQLGLVFTEGMCLMHTTQKFEFIYSGSEQELMPQLDAEIAFILLPTHLINTDYNAHIDIVKSKNSND